MMNLRKTVFALVAGAGLLAGCAAEQPNPGCYFQDSTAWYFRYDRETIDGTCSTAQQNQNGEQVGVFKFRELGQQEGKLAIRPAGAAAAANVPNTTTPTKPEDYPQNAAGTALGGLAAYPGGDHFCTVTAPSAINVVSAAGVRTEYTYENVRTYAGARSLGTLMDGKVTIKVTQANNTVCTRTMKFVANWPITACDWTLPAQSADDPATPTVDEAADSCGEGSGLNQDLKWKCIQNNNNPDPTVAGRCTLANDLPSFQDGVEELEYADAP